MAVKFNREIYRKQPMYNLIDLFAGAGGITAGFTIDLGNDCPPFEKPFRPVLALDFDRAAIETYRVNFGEHSIVGSIEQTVVRRLQNGTHCVSYLDEDGSEVNSVIVPAHINVLVGGPPCQGFSRLGSMNGWHREDPRNRLWQEYMRFVEILRPDIFLMENVPQLLTSRQGQEILDEAHNLGYFLAQPKVLWADLYGVPQKRSRAFILGSRIGPIELPEPTYVECTVRDAFANLPDPDGDPLHILRKPTPVSIERYQTIPVGGNRFDLMRERPDITPRCWLDKPTGSTDVMGRLWWDRPSLTIRTEFYKPEKGRYLHPDEHRPITHREAAALQTFPNNFVFYGSRIEIARQIGNAVPPLLAYHIAKVIYERLQNPRPNAGVNRVPDLKMLRKRGHLTQLRVRQAHLI